MHWDSHYYEGFLSAKKADFEKLKNLGVYFERSGIEIFEKMLADFKEMEEKLKNVAQPEGDSRSAYPEFSDVRAEWDKFIMKQKNLPSEFIGIVNRNFWDLWRVK